MNEFRQKCISRTNLVGPFAAIPHPVAVEVMASSGLDFLCIDWEHAQISRETIEAMVRAADVHRVPAMVRVPGHAPEAIQAALDSGAQGVLVPRVSTAEQAAMAVKASRYPPLGERGVGPGRAAGYGYRIPEYLAAANERIVVAVQVETAEGLANIEAIAAVDGVDLIFVGPG
ncbi:MAG: 4-hydroxy-2-oxovalerate aldolase, partial [Mesorhizobium sp.]